MFYILRIYLVLHSFESNQNFFKAQWFVLLLTDLEFKLRGLPALSKSNLGATRLQRDEIRGI